MSSAVLESTPDSVSLIEKHSASEKLPEVSHSGVDSIMIDITPSAESKATDGRSRGLLERLLTEAAVENGVEADSTSADHLDKIMDKEVKADATDGGSATTDLKGFSTSQMENSISDHVPCKVVEIHPEPSVDEHEDMCLSLISDSVFANKAAGNGTVTYESTNSSLTSTSELCNTTAKASEDEGRTRQDVVSSERTDPIVPKGQSQGRGTGRRDQPGQKLERALNFLKQGVNGGVRKPELEKGQESVLLSYLTSASPVILDSAKAATVTTSRDPPPLIRDSLLKDSRSMQPAKEILPEKEIGSLGSPNQAFLSSDVQMVGQVNKRKRKASHSLSDTPVLPLHIKEENVDDGYVITSNAPKVVVLDAPRGTRAVIASRNPGGNRKGNEKLVSIVSSSAVTPVVSSQKQRTMPPYRFASYKIPVAKNRVSLPPAGSLVSSVQFSAPRSLLVAPSMLTANRPNMSLLVSCRPSVCTTRTSTNSVNVQASRMPNVSQNTSLSFIQSGTVAASNQSPVLIVVNKQQSNAANQNGRLVVATGQQQTVVRPNSSVTIPRSLPKPSVDASTVVNSKAMRPIKVREANRNAAVLSRKFNLFYKKSILPKLTAPKLPESLRLSEPLKPFACAGCGDEFVTERGLDDHYARKSIIISFNCRCDRNTNIFYNMCSFSRFYEEHVTQTNGTGKPSYKIHSLYDSSVMAMLPPCLMPAKYQQIVNDREKEKQQQAANILTEPGIDLVETVDVASTPLVDLAAPPVLTQCSASLVTSDSPGPPIPTAEEFFNVLDRNNSMCLECEFVYKRRRGLTSHISGQRLLPDGSKLQCGKCFMLLPNICSFKAHSRIHNKLEPFVCPECGQVFRTSREVFMKHVKQVCLHFSRFQSRQCPICNATLSHTVESVVAHLEHVHVQNFHKCSACTMAFPTEKSFKSHNSAQHNNGAVSKTIAKCPFCKVAQMDKKSLVQHMTKHVSDDSLGQPCAFRCLPCSSNFSLRCELIEHMKLNHPDEIITGNMCEICGFVCENQVSLYGHINSEHNAFFKQTFQKKSTTGDANASTVSVQPSSQVIAESDLAKKESAGAVLEMEVGEKKTLECDRCQMVLSDDEQYARHVAKHRYLESKRSAAKSLKKEPKKRRIDKTDVAGNNDVQIKSEAVDSQETVSNSNEVTPFSSPCSSISQSMMQEQKCDVDSALRWFSCHLCEKAFKNSDNLQQHLKDAHAGKSRQHAYLCWICREQSELKSYPKSGMLIKHLKNFHKIARKNIDYARIAAIVSQEEVSGSADDGGTPKDDVGAQVTVRKLRVEGEVAYNCAKCEFSCLERPDFLEHIVKHRQGESHQCPECGTCFIVLPSLKRHLFVVHRVRDFSRYETETGFSLEQPAEAESDSDPGEDYLGTVSTGLDIFSADSTLQSDEAQSSPDKKGSNLECTVCYRSFDDLCTLRQHMRVHGMAFIQGTRRSNKSRRSASSDG